MYTDSYFSGSSKNEAENDAYFRRQESNKTINLFIILISIALAVFRVSGEKGEIFQAVAHIFIGGMIVAYYFTRSKLVIGLVIALSLVEVVCFFAMK